MNILENVSMAFNALRAGKMRSILTMLGIIIGIGSVIGIYSVGDALSGSILGSLQSFGVSNIVLALQPKGTSNDDIGMGVSIPDANYDDLITYEMLDMITDLYDGDIEAMALEGYIDAGKTKNGRNSAKISLYGVNDGYGISNNIKILKGRFISEKDTQGSKLVAVVSDKYVNKIFKPNEDPLGQPVQLNLSGNIVTVTIIGVYKYENTMPMGMMMGDDDIETNIYIPITATARINGNVIDGFSYVTLMARSDADMDTLSDSIESTFKRIYKNNPDFDVVAVSMESMIEQVSSIITTISIAISVIAGISLLVGGIGVMNIMLVSVTERTREIGTRKALGAPNSAIRSQFIIESMILCLVGGGIGILLGIGIGALGASLLGSPASTSINIIIIAVGFSMAIGVFFGYYPANKAAKLDPIEALRYE